MNHRIIKFDNKRFNFYECILIYYKNKYNITSFENINELLNTDLINTIDKSFYNIPIPIFGQTDRNSIFVKNFHNYVDTSYTFINLYTNFIKSIIKPLFPDELNILVQKTPNIRFHLPNCSNIGKRITDIYDDIIGVHYDGEFGHPTEEINVIVPITDMFDTNSLYYESDPILNTNVYDFNNLKLKQNELYLGNLNKCKHYNKINNTNQTRVSLDFRIIPYSKYIQSNNTSATDKIKFVIGEYYMII
jgi:hypothetical protein